MTQRGARVLDALDLVLALEWRGDGRGTGLVHAPVDRRSPAPQKEEIVRHLTDAMVDVTGENIREVTLCILEEVGSGLWGIGGQTLTTDDARALARGEVPVA